MGETYLLLHATHKYSASTLLRRHECGRDIRNRLSRPINDKQWADVENASAVALRPGFAAVDE